jgi:hypothetical protein
MIHHSLRRFFLFIPLFCFLAGCGIPGWSPQPQSPTLQATRASTSPAPQPTTLQVTRVRTSGALQQRSWTITDVKHVHQLFQVIQTLPRHQNNGADACVTAPSRYFLTFLVGAKSIQQDALGVYCKTLTLENGSGLDPTDTFNSLFQNMLNVNDLWAATPAPFA